MKPVGSVLDQFLCDTHWRHFNNPLGNEKMLIDVTICWPNCFVKQPLKFDLP